MGGRPGAPVTPTFLAWKVSPSVFGPQPNPATHTGATNAPTEARGEGSSGPQESTPLSFPRYANERAYEYALFRHQRRPK